MPCGTADKSLLQGFFVTETRWLHENREKYSGHWVALDGDRLMASGLTAKAVYSKAKAEGVEIPFVELVTDPEPVPSTGGWLS